MTPYYGHCASCRPRSEPCQHPQTSTKLIPIALWVITLVILNYGLFTLLKAR